MNFVKYIFLQALECFVIERCRNKKSLGYVVVNNRTNKATKNFKNSA